MALGVRTDVVIGMVLREVCALAGDGPVRRASCVSRSSFFATSDDAPAAPDESLVTYGVHRID